MHASPSSGSLDGCCNSALLLVEPTVADGPQLLGPLSLDGCCADELKLGETKAAGKLDNAACLTAQAPPAFEVGCKEFIRDKS